MRDIAGLLLLDAGMLIAGTVLIAGLGIERSPRALLRYAGLALVAGWAATGVLLSLALAAGITLSAWLVVGIWLVVAVVGIGLRTRLRLEPWRPAAVDALPDPTILWLARLGVAVAVIASAARTWFPDGRLHPDVWNVWLPKAKIIYFFGTLTTQPGGFTSQISPDYPPLHTGMDAVAFTFMGGPHVLRLPLQSWILALGVLAALYRLLRLAAPQHVAWVGVALFALMPSYVRLVGSDLADDPLAALFALTGITAALWLIRRDSRLLVLSALFAAAATMTKNEGSMLVLVTALALGIAAKRVRWAVAFVSLAVVCVAAWRIWLHANHVPRNFAYDFAKLGDFSYLSHRTYRFGYGLAQTAKALVAPGHWLLIPLALLVLAALAPARRDVRVFVVATFLLAWLGYVTIYWISPVPLHAYIDSSSTRVVDTIALFSAAVLPLLAVQSGKATTPSSSA